MSTPNNCVMLGCPPSSYTDRQAQNWQFRYAQATWTDTGGGNGYYIFEIPAFSAIYSGIITTNGGPGFDMLESVSSYAFYNAISNVDMWSWDGVTWEVTQGWGYVSVGEIFLAKSNFFIDDLNSPGYILGGTYFGTEFFCKKKRYLKINTPGSWCGINVDPADGVNAAAVLAMCYLDFSSLYVPADCGQDTGPNNFPTSPASDLTQGSPA